jgi:hypothetical protein
MSMVLLVAAAKLPLEKAAIVEGTTKLEQYFSLDIYASNPTTQPQSFTKESVIDLTGSKLQNLFGW